MDVLLRAIEPEDADFMYDAESDPEAWKYSDYVAPLSRELLRQYALTYDADPLRAGQLRLIIEAGGKPIGIVDLFDISARHLRADTGIYICPEFRNNGLGVQSLIAIKQYCSERLGMHHLSATIANQNDAAKRCYEKAGFQACGTRPDWIRNPDGYESALCFYITL